MPKIISEQKTQKLTKIVATIGSASESEEVLKEMILAGMNVARFNTKHGTPDWHQERIRRVKKVAAELGIIVGILLDLQGPEIRINLQKEFVETGFEVKRGDRVYFTSKKDLKKPNVILVPQKVIKSVEPGLTILTDDGLCQFVADKKDAETIEAIALDNFTVKSRKTLSIPGTTIDMPVLIENDYAQLDGVKDDMVDYVALSFVRNKKDIDTLRKELEKRKMTAGVMAKIENRAALDNLDEIVQASDAIMIARGDLGVEVAYEELIYWQKEIINKCRQQAKPVITATHMLETMIESPVPTRAEISDVAHAIYDLTDAIMLSGETTLGKYPVKAVAVQAKIAEFNEIHTKVVINHCGLHEETSRVSEAAASLFHAPNSDINKIICVTASGKTASLLALNRPKVPIHVLTDQVKVCQRLSLVYGVVPHLVKWIDRKVPNAYELLQKIGKVDWLQKGDRVLITHGSTLSAGCTSTVTVLTIRK